MLGATVVEAWVLSRSTSLDFSTVTIGSITGKTQATMNVHFSLTICIQLCLPSASCKSSSAGLYSEFMTAMGKTHEPNQTLTQIGGRTKCCFVIGRQIHWSRGNIGCLSPTDCLIYSNLHETFRCRPSIPLFLILSWLRKRMLISQVTPCTHSQRNCKGTQPPAL